jgi:hypothetical protein
MLILNSGNRLQLAVLIENRHNGEAFNVLELEPDDKPIFTRAFCAQNYWRKDR